MNTPPDLDALARRYVELWQDQVSAAAADPEATAALTRMLQLMTAGMGATATWWQALWPQPSSDTPRETNAGTTHEQQPQTAAPELPRQHLPRQGPRPLPLHLLAAGATWHSSRLALPFLKSGLLPWNPALASRAESLARDLAGTELPDLAAAVETELALRADRLAAGLEAYRHHAYRRTLDEMPVVWQSGTTRLIDYGPADGMPLLVVPSLINRAYILDLMESCSMLRGLAAHGIRPLLVDWDRPGEIERGFGLTDYVAGRLDEAFDAAAELAGGPVALMGYCMGGLLALALGLRHRREVSALVLLATPWDFHTPDTSYAGFLGALAEPLAATFGPLGEVPTDMLQALFTIADPQLAIRKFSRFAGLDAASPEAIRFVATEDWLNDGVPLALPAARECLGGWYGTNSPQTGSWRIAGRPVLPADFDRPALVVLPARDRIVPPASAEALAAALPQAERLTPDLGHIGIVVGSKAPEQVWAPVAGWLDRVAAPKPNNEAA